MREAVVSDLMSQESKVSRTASIRRDIDRRKKRQDAGDFEHALAVKDGMQEALAIRDMVESTHVPIFGGVRQNSVSGQSLGRNSVTEEDSSSVLRSLRNIPRTQGPLTATDHEYHRKEREAGRGPITSETDVNVKLVAASQLQKAARGVLDGSRLFFEAATLFDEIGMLDKAVACFERCTRHAEDAGAVVDAYDLTQDAAYARKLERMSRGARDAFLVRRLALRGALVAAECERVRLRAMVSYCQLCRLYLQLDDYPNSHRCLVAAFHTTVSFAEHTELLLFFNDNLKAYGAKFSEVTLDQQLARGSAGMLAEAHISILHELLEEDGTNADTLEWLGRRYAERCNFDESRHYFRRARDLRSPVHVAEDLRSLNMARADAYDDAAFLVNISKAPAREYSLGNDADVRLVSREGGHTRNELAGGRRGNMQHAEVEDRDFAWPQGLHEGRNTIIYAPPPQGWRHACVAQLQRQGFLGITNKLPPRGLVVKGI